MVVRELAPPLAIDIWHNSGDLSLKELVGKVVVLHAFQMLCPGCVSHGIPQAQRIHDHFQGRDVAVIGLHSVFEHHDAQGPVSLAAFLHEYRISFPVGIDRPSSDSPVPQTMAAYQMRGTPSLVLIDCNGRVAHHMFGRPPDLAVGAEIASLLADSAKNRTQAPPDVASDGCDDTGCALPSER